MLTPQAAQSSNIAFWAHVGGFVTGMILILPFWGKARRIKAAEVPRYSSAYDDMNRW
jgi:membrane associated rhomboid family serine protease